MAILVLTWGATLLPAAPAPASSFRLTLALPVPATIDFSDLDLRDANNRPIVAPVIRQRFEEILNRELNRLLVENLTPLRRAWIAALSQEHDVFGAWFQRASTFVHRWIWTMAGRGHRWLAPMSGRLVTSTDATKWASQHADKTFLSLLFLVISSTRLLR